MAGSPRELLENALPALERVAAEKRATALEEHDLQEALEAVSGAGSAELTLRHWPEVGPLDLLIGHDAYELQWCQSGDVLAGCSWDIAKLATAIAERKITEGWIIAAAPTWHWQSRRPGVGLFREQTYFAEELIEDYEDWWRLWCNEVTSRPTHLPLSFAVTDPDSISVRLGRVPFEIRFACVEVLKLTWNPYVCPHRWRDRPCLPRAWDPDGLGRTAAGGVSDAGGALSRWA